MTYKTLRYEDRGKVAVITYDRPDRRNAWDVPMYREVVAAIERANAAAAVGAIVITHEGPTFCAGGDLKAPPEPPDPVTGRSPTIASLAMAQDTSWLHLLARSKPTICASRGPAIGLGVTQILPMDIRLAGPSATYAFPFLERSLMPELGATALLSRLVGYGRAVDICLSSATLDAVEAERIGLISRRLLQDDQVLPAAIDLGEKLAAAPSLQMRLTRRLLADNVGEADLNQLLKRESYAFIEMFRSAR